MSLITFYLSIILVNLLDSHVCELPRYPGQEGKGPGIMEYIPAENRVAACGSFQLSDRSCHALEPGMSSWKVMPSVGMDYCNNPTRTKSHYSPSLGLGIFGQRTCDNIKGGLNTEIFSMGIWTSYSTIGYPYTDGFAGATCSVLLNSTTIMVTGGWKDNIGRLDSSLIVHLETGTWTSVAKMPAEINQHTCVLTAEGEVLIAGGAGGSRSVYVYNVADNLWRQEQDLPSQIETLFSVSLLWNNKPLLLEHNSDLIWQRTDTGDWQMLNSSMGDTFQGIQNRAILVPGGVFTCP